MVLPNCSYMPIRKIIRFAVFLISMFAWVTMHAQQSGDTTRQFLNRFIDQWHHDAAGCNHEAYIGAMADSGVFIGTDATERWTYVLSATIPNSLMKQVTALKAGIDSGLVIGSIFEKYGMNGTLLITDLSGNLRSGYNPASWDSGYLPASTFKIPNSLIGLEIGVIDTSHVFRWDGKKRRLPQWEKDLTLKEAFRVSCVPCYQELARKIGPERMNSYLRKFEYGTMDVKPGNIDLFWLEGDSRITPAQQVVFLRKLHDEKLPLKPSTLNSMKSIMVNEVTPEYKLSGKTGWAVRNGNNYGWFVGWIETKGKVFYVATLVEPKNQEAVSDFAMARKTITMEALRALGIVR